MQQNESAPAPKAGGSQTTIKALGVEFSGPSWVALVLAVAVIIGGIVYLSDGDDAEESNDATAEMAAPAETADTAEPASDEAATDQAAPGEEATGEQPAAASGEVAP